jgi:hypothetical protein
LPDLFIVAFIIFAAWGLYLLVTGQGPDQILGREVRRLQQQNRTRAPVVYLRSFEAEKLTLADIKAAFVGKVIPGTMGYWHNVGHFVTDFLSVVGPACELEPPAGRHLVRGWAPSRPHAVRVADDQWQQHVRGLLTGAALVVVQIDRSPGLDWELRQVVRTVPPIKVLLVLPPTKAVYEEARKWARNFFPVAFPDAIPESRLMTFKPGWQPMPLASTDIWLSLKPVFDQNGFEWPRQVFARK